MSFSPADPLARLTARAFVVSTPVDGGAGWAYFLCAAPVPGTPGFAELWRATSGIVLFANYPIAAADADAFAAQFEQQLGTPITAPAPWRVVAWTDDPYAPADLGGIHASLSQPGVYTLHKGWSGAWSLFGLALDAELTIRLGTPGDPAVLGIDIAPHDISLLHVTLGGAPQMVGYPREGMHIAIRLGGVGAGSLRVPLGLDPSMLTTGLRCGMICGVSGQPVFFPMLRPVLRSFNRMLAFDVWLNPIRPLDGSCTRFSLDGTGRLGTPGFVPADAAVVTAPFFADRSGNPVRLRPFDPTASAPDAVNGGFSFSLGPAALVPGAPVPGAPGEHSALYLSPCGQWQVDPPGTLRLMPGLGGGEFLALGPTDRVEFVANCPAAMDGPVLDASITTSWLRVLPGTGPAPGYFGQPGASAFYGAAGTAPFPLALDVELASFAAPSALMPVIPYGGVALPVPADRDTHYPPPFAGDPALLVAFDATLAATRHAVMAQSPLGPVFMPEGDAAPDGVLDRAATPQGLLLELTPATGTASGLVLARSPPSASSGGQPWFLRFDAGTTGVLPPVLGNLLTQDGLFLVISLLPNELRPPVFHAMLDLAGFDLQFDIGADGGTILVLKFGIKDTLRSLAGNPAAWAAADTFNAEPAATAARLAASIVEADGAANAEAFATFQAIVDDPEWTGMLAFEVAVNGNGMPLDLQMLLGGIDGMLRAHHIGIEANRFAPAAGQSIAVQESSLFGVVRYDSAPGIPATFPDYEVEHLLVVFSNSRVTQAEATIGVTFDTLFGRTVWLDGGAAPAANVPPNTLRIAGTSQTVDGDLTLSFTTTAPIPFDFRNPDGSTASNRVLRRVEVTRASLVPVSATPLASGAGETITLHLLMSGRMLFAPDPFPPADGSAGLDLFSYGTGPDAAPLGLAFSGLAVEISFTLDGSMVPGSKQQALRTDLVQAAPEAGAIRAGSFLAAIPAQFSSLVTTTDGMASASSGTTPINMLDLEGTPPHTTGAPAWALEYDVHLGSLGALSDDQAGIAAKLLLGWGPSPVAPDDDAAAMLIQLPHLAGGVGGFSLEGLLTTRFGDANLLRVDLGTAGKPDFVYAILFNNVQLAFLGYAFPPGLLVDFAVFGGTGSGAGAVARNAGNLAWFMAAKPA